MKRLHATALAAALAAAVPAWGDPPARDDKVLTLTKDGQPHQYQVLKTYPHPSGGTAYDIRDATTGEVMTVIENASPDQIKATLKPDTVTEVKAGDASKSEPVAAPAAKAATSTTSKAVSADPAAPASQYTKPPVPALKRWFGWMRPDTKPASPAQKTANTPPDSSGMIEAAYHPDRVYRLIGSLRDDLLPSMREVAAMELANVGRDRPEAVTALIDAAAHDPAPTVRACCVRQLGELRVRSAECRVALESLRDDRNRDVRTEASVVLAHWQP